ncbi:MarR family winged helix-turn-helix transcriptional regulator [Actinoplanes friuliensis]|uniref:MarR family transcriptional regulator n=1 Tax=Actinoplanes friuliensis DSM 7358 TaxID=1246995 RepID=U5W2Z1_9ACTN|nr:MarR family transcriptional regulator [Actinoplanes friuliensis]AGZ42360.1 MarR family transcriptional regulator [Actinoplanes friuliensis DSM 7358]
MSNEGRWLDEQQLQAWMRLSALLVVLPAELDGEMQSRAGMTQFEYGVLAALSDAPGGTMRISTLAGFARGSLSRMSHLIKRLERRGWVRRELDPSDGRYTNAILTEDGRAKLVATAPGHVEDVRRLVIDALTPAQLRQLGEISDRLLRNINGTC